MLREWKLPRHTLRLGERTLVMGILNVTPDSFSDGGRFFSPESALRHAEQMMLEGADILDVGGESTRPGGDMVAVDEELRRVIPIIERLANSYDLPVSVDTTRAEVARMAVKAGAEIINDISGLRFDPDVAPAVSENQSPLHPCHRPRGQRRRRNCSCRDQCRRRE